MTHAELREAIAVYRDLRGAEREEVDRHMAGCAECSSLLNAYRIMDRNLAGLRDARPDQRLREGFYAAIGRGDAASRVQPQGRVPVVAFAAAAVLLVVIASAIALWQSGLPGRVTTINRPVATPIPTPHSSLIGSFVWQTDGAFGYQMLRPAGWETAQAGDLREFVTPGSAQSADALMITVGNLQARPVSAQGTGGTPSIIVSLFEKAPTIDGWMAGIEQAAASAGAQPKVVRRMASARIYVTLDAPAGLSPMLMLSAYKVDDGRPLVITLLGTGAYASLDRLEAEGIVDDLATMVESARAIPADPQRVAPALSQGTPSPRQVSTAVATPIATPHNSLIGGFVWQTDGAYGYRMLRPAGWEAKDLGDSRQYVAPGPGLRNDWLYMYVVNYQARFGGDRRSEAASSWEYAAFEQNPTLEGWSSAVEQKLRSLDAQPELVRSLPDVRIYTARKDLIGSLSLMALKVEGRQPLDIRLWTSGTYADVNWLESQGVLDDFVTMVESARALPADARNVSPWLPSATPTRTLLCDVVCQDATASAALTLTPVPLSTYSPSFQATEDAYYQRLSATQTRQAQITPTVTPTPTSTPTPRPAGPGLAVYEGAGAYDPQPRFELVYATGDWTQTVEGLAHSALSGCSMALHALGREVKGGSSVRTAQLGSYAWTVKTFLEAGISSYALSDGGSYFLMEVAWPAGSDGAFIDRCREAGEKVLGTFKLRLAAGPSQTTTTQVATVPPYPGLEPGAVKAQTSDWSTYQNTEYGFRLKYPANFFQRTWQTDGERLLSVSFIDKKWQGIQGGVQDMGITVYANPSRLPLDEWFWQHSGSIPPTGLPHGTYFVDPTEVEKVSINGETGLRFVNGGMGSLPSVLIPHGSYIFKLYYGPSPDDLRPAYELSLSTLEFTK